jgi:hypothetical protein
VAGQYHGNILHFDGMDWRPIKLPGDAKTMSISGATADGVFAVDNFGGIYKYDGAQWTTRRQAGSPDRSVIDLAYHRTNPDIIYAATDGAGVYISPNQGDNWLNLGKPPSSVKAIASGSLYASTGEGVYQLTGLGVLAGQVRSAPDILPIDGATVVTDLNTQCRSIEGEYMMVVPASVLNAYAEAEHFERATAENLTVVGSDVTWRDFDLLPAEDVEPALDTPGYTPGTSPTDNADGGGYCFIGSLQTSVPMKSKGLALGYIKALIAAAGGAAAW